MAWPDRINAAMSNTMLTTIKVGVTNQRGVNATSASRKATVCASGEAEACCAFSTTSFTSSKSATPCQ